MRKTIPRMVMKNFQGPLDVKFPGLADQITKVVTDFAKENELLSEAWYHNDPLWLVSKAVGPITRTVHIANFVPDDAEGPHEELLFFIPSAHIFDKMKGETLTVPPETTKALQISKPMRRLEEMQQAKRAEKLHMLLKRAWDEALKLTKQDLTYKLVNKSEHTARR